jgi:hypothetical protein
LCTASQIVLAEDEWSVFHPLAERPAVPPDVADSNWSQNPIDTYVYSSLEKAGLKPASLVGRRVWLRRVTFDLTGLPPTPDEIDAFLSDTRPDAAAYSAVVDRLLASPRYGERWARHWLDVVRYGDSDGFAIDKERPTMWRFRDYVIRAFNDDRPFDRFIREQLAGDEINAGSEGIVATSFYRLGPYEADNMVAENRRQDFLNEITSTVGNAFLGLSMGCARCHDHKYDPILQTDYYQLQSFFTPLQRANVAAEFIEAELTGKIGQRKAEVDGELRERREALEEFRLELKTKLANAEEKLVEDISVRDLERAVRRESTHFTDAERKRYTELKQAVDSYLEGKRFESVAVTVKNPDGNKEIPATHVLLVGDVFNPGERVQPGFLSAVDPWSADLVEEVRESASSSRGRRRILADWIASPENPVTTRVFVNRIWHYHMGQGLVATPNEFGTNGSGPSHPELLDFLAHWFMDHGWSLKPLHRLLVLSHTYRLSTTHLEATACAQVDPDNRLLWRSNFRRLEAETIRDAMLAASGSLNLEQGGPGYYETLPDEMTRSVFMFTWKPSAEAQRFRRTIYMFQRRNFILPMMEVFDSADMTESCEQRKTSVTASQALSLFNSKFAYMTSRLFAERILREAGEKQVEYLFQVAFSSPPEQDELDACLRFLATKRQAYVTEQQSVTEQQRHEKADASGQHEQSSQIEASKGKQDEQGQEEQKPANPELDALTDLCLAIFNTNRFLYLE